uniref:Uncharacterized protein n=1 Tax=Rhizophora mucronata TaxID=61149 RepID=A0A2P2NQD1_RHIMU
MVLKLCFRLDFGCIIKLTFRVQNCYTDPIVYVYHLLEIKAFCLIENISFNQSRVLMLLRDLNRSR